MNMRKAARGKACTLRIPTVCNGNPETTVLAHVRRPWNAGVGMKPSDLHAVFACSACHDELDGRTRMVDRELLQRFIVDALLRMISFRDDPHS